MIKELDDFVIRNIQISGTREFAITREKVNNFNYTLKTSTLVGYLNSKDAISDAAASPSTAINSPFELKKNTIKEINILPLRTSIVKITEQVEKIPQLLFFNISIIYSNSSLVFNLNSKTKPGKLEKIKNDQIIDLPGIFFIQIKEYIFECEMTLSYNITQPDFIITFSKILNTFIENFRDSLGASAKDTASRITDDYFKDVVLDESNFLGFGIKYEVASYINYKYRTINKVYNAELTLSYPEDKSPLEEIKDWKYIEKIKIDTIKLFQDSSKVLIFSFNEDIKKYSEVQIFIKNILEFYHRVNDANIELLNTGIQRTFDTKSDIHKNTSSGNTKIILIFSHEITIDSNSSKYFKSVFNQDENKLEYIPTIDSDIIVTNIKTINNPSFSTSELIFPSINIQCVSILNALQNTQTQKKLQLINNYFITKEIIETANNEINSG